MPNVLEQPVILSGNASRDEMLLSLFNAFEHQKVAAEEALEAMKAAALERERTSSTFLGRGLALPHGRTDALDEIRIAVGISDAGIPWDEDGNRAHLVILLGVPASMIRDYLLLMQKILRWHKDTKTLDAAGRVIDAASLLSELKSLIS
ncbi:MAG: PTS sugar transporter subunit IIA [Opitutales bacterium]|nr:PTS sugar transporter subunit IIA [Opitutales bacterium]